MASTPPIPATSTSPLTPLAPAVFGKLRGTRVSDDIAAKIRSQVESGKLKVGSRLPSERALSEQLGVGRNALREALRLLENAGLIRLEKGVHGGAIVQDRGRDAIASSMVDMYHLGSIQPRHLTQARILYESVVIRLACAEATPADLQALYANIDAAEQARSAGEFGARIELHIEFHRMLARITGNPILEAVMNGVLEVFMRFLQTLGPYENSFVTPSRRRFMVHFAARDAEAAVAEMEKLLKRLEKSYLSRLGPLQP